MQRHQWLRFAADGTPFDFDRAEIAAVEQAFELIGVTPSHPLRIAVSGFEA
jgi:hypothetical protein